MPPLNLGPWIILIFLWQLAWKGVALWRAAKLGQKNWFIAMLVVSSIGILEIIYLFAFAKEKLTLEEIKSWLPLEGKKEAKGKSQK